MRSVESYTERAHIEHFVSFIFSLTLVSASASASAMKKLYRRGSVHPSPPAISDQLSFLPAAILSLSLALSPEEREVLAYLISGNPRRSPKLAEHPPLFDCRCFGCYTSYWVRWNSSPNHQLIHQIIDAFEDSLASKPSKKDKKTKRASRAKPPSASASASATASASASASASPSPSASPPPQVEEDKPSVTSFLTSVGQRIWAAWA